MTPIYLDWNATSPLRPEAEEAMRTVPFGNPSSAHHAGRAARRFLEDSREQVAALLGATPEEVIFTSGATEANNLAVMGLVESNPSPGPSPKRGGEKDSTPAPAPPLRFGEGVGGWGCHDPSEEGVGTLDRPHLLASQLEHPCVIEPLKQLAARGFAVEWLPVTPRGQVEPATVLGRVRDETQLVCLMLANHETGAIQPVRHVAKTLPKHIPLHCDAAQAIGKMSVNFHDLGVTTLTASAHKFGGPKGVGVFLLKKGTKLRPQVFGGHQQHGHRPGTEPVALAVGLAKALELAVRELDPNRAKLDSLRTRLLAKLKETAAPLVVNSDPEGLPTTLNLSFPGCRSDLLLMSLDLAGVACSTGSACSSGSLLPSPVLQAMGVPDEVLRSAMRFSLGPTLCKADIDDAATRIAQCVTNVRGIIPGT